jgi:hypothetical protein
MNGEEWPGARRGGSGGVCDGGRSGEGADVQESSSEERWRTGAQLRWARTANGLGGLMHARRGVARPGRERQGLGWDGRERLGRSGRGSACSGEVSMGSGEGVAQPVRRVREGEVRERAWAGEGERTRLPFIEGERERKGCSGSITPLMVGVTEGESEWGRGRRGGWLVV